LYGADWCIPCQRFKPSFYKASEGYLAEDLGVEFEYKDVDEMSPEALSELRISSVPTVLVEHDGVLSTIQSRTLRQFEMEVEYLITKD